MVFDFYHLAYTKIFSDIRISKLYYYFAPKPKMDLSRYFSNIVM